MSARRHTFYRYRGLSMRPCFQEGDLLEIAALPLPSARVGDCVLLRTRDGQHVAHRVVGVRGGLRTRGDALPGVDCHQPGEAQLCGRVIARYRLGQRSPVAGGWAGRLAGLGYRYAGRIDPQRTGRGGQLARWLGALCAPLLQPLGRRGTFHTFVLSGGEEMTVWQLGGKAVAQRTGGGDAWQVAWPWRIVLRVPAGARRAT